MDTSTPATQQDPMPVSVPDQPPTEAEQVILRFLLQMHQSAYNRLQEAGSPWADVVQAVGSFWDDVLSPEETP